MRIWLLLALLAGCATSGKRESASGKRPLCAQPVADGKCLEGTWPAARRDGQWDCKIIQDALELDGIPADRCQSFVSERELVEKIHTIAPATGGPRRP